MEERRLGPVVGLGTWSTFDHDARLAAQVVEAAFGAGTRLFDSSPMYGGAEASLSAALAARRDEAIVATKIWAQSVEEGREQFRRQLDWYGGRVDVEQIHNLAAWREQLAWLEREEGTIGRLGVTHYRASALPELAAALRTRKFQVLQVPYNPWERECEEELLPLAEELGVAVIAMRPLGGSEERGRRRLELSDRDREALGVETWAQALLSWALADPRIDSVIPATSNPERAASNARVVALDDEQRRLVERLAQ
ncbi:MAG TPA: aldo/keto reductase [Gaiellaceae bacterium]|jgi:diketogulonate reductase-like aldo/keto reductase|nr:aldo/keto reductase [Gaiellaceae bacterium]